MYRITDLDVEEFSSQVEEVMVGVAHLIEPEPLVNGWVVEAETVKACD